MHQGTCWDQVDLFYIETTSDELTLFSFLQIRSMLDYLPQIYFRACFRSLGVRFVRKSSKVLSIISHQ